MVHALGCLDLEFHELNVSFTLISCYVVYYKNSSKGEKDSLIAR